MLLCVLIICFASVKHISRSISQCSVRIGRSVITELSVTCIQYCILRLPLESSVKIVLCIEIVTYYSFTFIRDFRYSITLASYQWC